VPKPNDVAIRILENVEKVVVGKRNTIVLALVTLFSKGHVLIEDVPGVGKTMLARSIARSVGCAFSRIQCTPDLMPTDVTGTSIFSQKTSDFEFRPGPVLANIVLADEINRATPRTQSAPLEAMGERQVTIDGLTHVLSEPFMVIATQNPIEHEGTFPLPEAQLDRFLMRLSMGYPTFEDENTMIRRLSARHPIEDLAQVVSRDEVVATQEALKSVTVHDTVLNYILKLVFATRSNDNFDLGGSPRASIYLHRAGQALAFIKGRDFVLPDDVKKLFVSILEHRVILKPEVRLRRVGARDVLEDILDEVEAPVPVK